MMSKSLWPSATLLSCREAICAPAKTTSGLVIPFFQHACGHGLLNIPPRPEWDLKMGNDHAQFQGTDLKTSPVFAKQHINDSIPSSPDDSGHEGKELARVAASRGTNKSALFKLLALPIGPFRHHPGGFQPAAG